MTGGGSVIDYHAECVALDVFMNELSAATFGSEAVRAGQKGHLTAAAGEDGFALLGTFMHHLLAHAVSDGSEVALLQRTSDLWGRGAALCDEVGTIRAAVEGALAKPTDPGAADQFNAATVHLQELANRAIALN